VRVTPKERRQAAKTACSLSTNRLGVSATFLYRGLHDGVLLRFSCPTGRRFGTEHRSRLVHQVALVGT